MIKKVLTMSAKPAYSVRVGKKKLSHEEVIEILRKRQGKKSLRQFAEEFGVTAAYLSDLYKGNRQPGPMILEPLGLSKVVEQNIFYETVA